MVKLDLVRSANAALVASQPLVAVFVGGTSGIGKFSLHTLAATHGRGGKGLRVYIVARNATAAQKIISECQELCPPGQFIFIQARDIALLKDVDRVSAELIEIEEEEAKAKNQTPKIDILVMSQAVFKPFDLRNETSEGLDRFFSLLYYSRMRFTIQLLPLLISSSLPAHVISIFGPQRSGTLFEDDLSLRDPKNYSFNNVCSHTAHFKTFFMEYLAAQNPGKLSLVHFFPGLVLTESFEDPSLPRVIRWTFKYGAPILKPFAVSAEKVGERVLFNASERYPAKLADGNSVIQKPGGIGVAESSDGVVGGGAYRVNSDGEQVVTEKQYKKLREEGWLDKAVVHTLKVFEEIQAGRVFMG